MAALSVLLAANGWDNGGSGNFYYPHARIRPHIHITANGGDEVGQGENPYSRVTMIAVSSPALSSTLGGITVYDSRGNASADTLTRARARLGVAETISPVMSSPAGTADAQSGWRRGAATPSATPTVTAPALPTRTLAEKLAMLDEVFNAP